MVCGNSNQEVLVGHHVSSFGASGDDSLENMITLCSNCHQNAHQGYIDYSKVNLPMRQYIPAPEGYIIGAMSKDKVGPKVWECDEIFRGILRGRYGY